MSRSVPTFTLAGTILLAGCSSVGSGPGGETMCREWLALDGNLSASERINEGKVNEEQQNILR